VSTVVYTRPNGNSADPFVLAALIDTQQGWTDTTCVINGTSVSVTSASQGASVPAIQTLINGYVYGGRWGLSGSPAVITLNGVAPLTWTNMPAALTEVPGSRTRLPLYCASYGRLSVMVITAGAAGATLTAQVSVDGNTWTSGPSVNIGSTGLKLATVAIPPVFQIDAFFRVVGQNGDGVADPVFGLVTVQIA
jgi:hypothetical protein